MSKVKVTVIATNVMDNDFWGFDCMEGVTKTDVLNLIQEDRMAFLERCDFEIRIERK